MRRRAVLLIVVGLLLSLVVGRSDLRAADVAPGGGTKAITLDTDSHLAGWWKLDEDSGASATDSSRYGRSGTCQGGLSFGENSVAGRSGRALQFDGQDDRLDITGYKGVSGRGARTLAAWIKTTRPRGEILSWGLDDFGKMWRFTFIRSRLGVTPKGGYFYMNLAVNDDAWHHVAAVVREADPPNLHDDVVLYLDGGVAEIHDIGLLDLWPIETGDRLDVRIGRGFQGLLDEVRIYDRALSEDEIKALYQLQGSSPVAGTE